MHWIVYYSLDSPPTYVTASWAQHFIEYLEDQGEIVTNVNPAMATYLGRWFIEKGVNPDIAVYLGHGFPDKMLGQSPLQSLLSSFLPLVSVGQNIKGVTIYNLACLTGLELLPYLAQKRNKNALGFTTYAYIAYPSQERNYKKDFRDLYMQPIKTWVNGGSLADARRRFLNKLGELVSTYRTIDSVTARDNRQALQSMRSKTKIFGDPTWSPSNA